jgi:putative SbcD/Mre11-related phosphoesterase
MNIEFITGEPAIKLGSTLVIADLHIGAEQDYRAAGISMPSQTARLEERLLHLISKNRAKRLIILGDVKHSFSGATAQEERELPQFFSRLSHHAAVEVVPGNHDGWLERLCPDVTIHPSEGVRVGDCYLSHGHAWPGGEFLKCKAVVMGHNHPQVEFRDRLGKVWRERIWVRAGMKKSLLAGRYGAFRGAAPDLVMMPAFNDFVGGWTVNYSSHRAGGAAFSVKDPGWFGPMSKCADIGHALAFMLDGTFLGEVGKI